MKLLAILAGIFGVLAVVLALRPSSSSWTWSRRMPAARLRCCHVVVFVPLLVVMRRPTRCGRTCTARRRGDGVRGGRVRPVGREHRRRNAILYANGIGQGALPYGDVHTALGALPPSSTRPRARPR